MAIAPSHSAKWCMQMLFHPSNNDKLEDIQLEKRERK